MKTTRNCAWLHWVFIPMLLIASGCGQKASKSAQDPVADLFARFPQDGSVYVVVPSPGAVLQEWSALEASGQWPDGPMRAVREMLGESGTDMPLESIEDMTAWLNGYGVDDSRPVGLAFDGSMDGESVIYVPISDTSEFQASPLIADSEPLALEVGGEAVSAGVGPEGAWFVADGYAVLAEDEDALRLAAAAFGAKVEDGRYAAAVANRTGGDILQVMQIGPLLEAIPPGPTGGMKQAIGETFDILLIEFSLVDAGDLGELRAVAMKRTPGNPDEAPLSLRHTMGPDTAFNIALKDCSALVDLIFASGGVSLPEAGPLPGILQELLGNEVALIVNMGNLGLPEATLVARPVAQSTIDELLAFGGLKTAPAGEHGGVHLRSLQGVYPLMGAATFTFQDDTLILSTSAAGVRTALDSFAAGESPKADSPNRAEVTVNMAKVFSSPFASMMGGTRVPEELLSAPPMTFRAWEHADSVELRLSTPMVAGNALFNQSMKAQGAAQSASSQNNQKQIGLICKMYANESKDGYFPPLMETPGHLMFALIDAADYREGRGIALYPEYIIETQVLINPGVADADVWSAKWYEDPASAAESGHYVYLGFFVRDEADMDAFTAAYLAAVEAGAVPNADVKHGGRTIYRLRDGVERFALDVNSGPADAARIQSESPLLMERPGTWADGAINVLYLDGHVASVPAGTFPNTDAFWANVARIEDKQAQ